MYLIDTDIIIYVLKGNKKVIENFYINASQPKAISVITYGELIYGAAKSQRVNENMVKVRRISELFPIIPLTPKIMETFGSLKCDLEREGKRMDDFDLLIASTALMMNYNLVTNNVKHYSRIPSLKIENWNK